MSSMGNIYLEIEEQLTAGVKPRDVASNLNVSVDMVYVVEDDISCMREYNGNVVYDEMD